MHVYIHLDVHAYTQKLPAYQCEILMNHLCKMVITISHLFNLHIFICYLAGNLAGFTHCVLLNLSSHLKEHCKSTNYILSYDTCSIHILGNLAQVTVNRS